jgi:hypothetical protein
MTMRWIVPVAAFIAYGSVALPAQSAPLGIVAGNTVQPSAVQQAHYYRHHRYYRYYRRPDVNFYYGPRHHRYWRHHRHWY